MKKVVSSIMKEILITYVTDFTDKRTKPFAFAVLLQNLEHHKQEMSKEEIKDILVWTNDFSGRYDRAWFWDKNKIIVDALREI